MRKDEDAVEWVDMEMVVEMLKGAAQPPEPPPRVDHDAPPAAKRPPSPRAMRLIESLPRGFRLHETRLGFPHVIEQIAAEWHDPARFARLLDELTLVDRPNRRGFPFTVLTELSNLRDYYFAEVHPAYRDRLRRGPL
jgi:hypothetical protein